MVTFLRHKTWSGIAVSAVWQGELVLCAVWDRSISISATDCVIVSGGKKKKEMKTKTCSGSLWSPSPSRGAGGFGSKGEFKGGVKGV